MVRDRPSAPTPAEPAVTTSARRTTRIPPAAASKDVGNEPLLGGGLIGRCGLRRGGWQFRRCRLGRQLCGSRSLVEQLGSGRGRRVDNRNGSRSTGGQGPLVSATDAEEQVPRSDESDDGDQDRGGSTLAVVASAVMATHPGRHGVNRNRKVLGSYQRRNDADNYQNDHPEPFHTNDCSEKRATVHGIFADHHAPSSTCSAFVRTLRNTVSRETRLLEQTTDGSHNHRRSPGPGPCLPREPPGAHRSGLSLSHRKPIAGHLG
jgi:hypothetical protein